MTDKGHVLVTPKGYQIQTQILKETLSDFPSIQSPKNPVSIRLNRSKVNQSPLCSPTSLSAYSLPRSGYFGPKEQHIVSPNISPKRNLHFFPNYMNKDAKTSPPRHFCAWKPVSTAQGKRENAVEIPKGKYIHHSLYHIAIDTKLAENPSIHGLNRAAFGKEQKESKEILVAESYENWDDIDDMKKSLEKFEKDMRKSYNSQGGVGNSSVFGSTGFSMMKTAGLSKYGNSGMNRFRNSLGGNENREERLFRKHLENEKNYEQMLERFSGDIKKKQQKYEENQHEAPEFMNKLKETNSVMEGLDTIKYNEDSRYVKRLKEFHKKKYEKTWSEHCSVEQSPEPKGSKKEEEKPKGLRGGALYNVTAGKIAAEKNEGQGGGIMALKIKTRKKLTINKNQSKEKMEENNDNEKTQSKEETMVWETRTTVTEKKNPEN